MSVIAPELVELDLDAYASTKDEAIERLVSLVGASGRATDVAQLRKDVGSREDLMPTGIEGGIGIPHARSSAVLEATVAFGRTTKGIDFGAADGPATLVFLIVAPEGGGNEHLKVLSALARKLIHQSFKDALKQAPDADTVVDVFVKEVGI